MAAEQILSALLIVNLAASVSILIVALLRKPVRIWLGAVSAYRLWLLVPIASLGAMLPSRTVVVPLKWTIATAAAPSAGHPLHGAAIALLALWLAGCIACWVVFTARIRSAMSDPNFGPALVGCLRPRLILPSDFRNRFDRAERRLILAHEATHARAGHPQVNGLVWLAVCVNWFNPLGLIAAYLMRADQELACDAAVLERRPTARRQYAEALLKSQAAVFQPWACQWRGPKPLISERIKMLGRPLPTRRHRLIGAGLSAALAALGGFAAWAEQPPRAGSAAAGHVCVTNDCQRPLDEGQAAAALKAAIKAGNPIAVRALGGSPSDILAAVQAQMPKEPEVWQDEFGKMAAAAQSGRLVYVPGAHNNGLNTDFEWGVERISPDGSRQRIYFEADGQKFLTSPRHGCDSDCYPEIHDGASRP